MRITRTSRQVDCSLNTSEQICGSQWTNSGVICFDCCARVVHAHAATEQTQVKEEKDIKEEVQTLHMASRAITVHESGFCVCYYMAPIMTRMNNVQRALDANGISLNTKSCARTTDCSNHKIERKALAMHAFWHPIPSCIPCFGAECAGVVAHG